jgi:hypothetical protein
MSIGEKQDPSKKAQHVQRKESDSQQLKQNSPSVRTPFAKDVMRATGGDQESSRTMGEMIQEKRSTNPSNFYGDDAIERGVKTDFVPWYKRPAAQPPAQMKVNKPGDAHEAEADQSTERSVQQGGAPVQRKVSSGGLDQDLVDGFAATSGHDLSDVNVHRNSSRPSEVGALAYTQGNDIHLGPGQEKHLPHEAAHIVQQREGRVKPTTEKAGMPVNDNKGLENEADTMGAKAMQIKGGDQDPSQNTTHSSPTGPAQFRLPSYASLNAMLHDPDLGLSEAVIKDRVTRALTRMAAEGRLQSTDPVADIVARIFPGGGVVDEAAFNAAVDEGSRNTIYKDVADADAPIAKEDRSKFKGAVRFAVSVIRATEGMDTSLKRIFGGRTADAKRIYHTAGDILERMISSNAELEARITTDYNEDDSELNMAGLAGSGQMHLDPSVVRVDDLREAIFTLIHEACHLADPNVVDLGYYPPATNENAFAAMPENIKVANAAHFEEFPRRWMGRSKYANDFWFRPGVSMGGGGVSLEDQARGKASGYFEDAWTAALLMQIAIRGIRKEMDGGDNTSFNANLARILEISRKFEMTIHEQDPAHRRITDLDLVISEGVVRSVGMLIFEVSNLTVPPIADAADLPAAVDALIASAIGKWELLGDNTKDTDLLNFLSGSTGF